jgi:hypothetical protein
MHLSDMTAIELAGVLAADPSGTNIGFVLATSETDGDPAQILPNRRTVVVLRKPFDQTSLTHALGQAISS